MHFCNECGAVAFYYVPEDYLEEDVVPETYWCETHGKNQIDKRKLLNSKPVHQHDCEECIYLGTLKPRTIDGKPTKKDSFIDCYYCPDPTYPNLSSLIGRFGSDGPEYASSHPMQNECLLMMERWYLFCLLQATFRGFLNKTRDQIHI